MSLLFIDIETLPTSDPQVIADIHSAIKHPGNIKKAETITTWWETDGEQAKTDAVAKTSFDGMYGRIACICWAFDDGPVEASANSSEFQMLVEFYDLIKDHENIGYHGGSTQPGITVVGHNVAGFDLPFLKHRSIIHGIKPPAAILKAMNAKPWDACLADTMLMWSPDREKRASMEKLCKALGIAGKGDFDGSMVAATWPVDPDRVIDYCKGDVDRTRQIYRRLSFSK
jgi:hypothetical protein